MQRLRSNLALAWLVQGLLLLAMCPFGTVQCQASADGAISIELTLNGVCLTCITQNLECAGCNTYALPEQPTLRSGADSGCLQAPPAEQVAVRSAVTLPTAEFVPIVSAQPLLAALTLPRSAVVPAATLDPRRSSRLQPVAILRI